MTVQPNLTVTGELGDQIFGSAKCEAAFGTDSGSGIDSGAAKAFESMSAVEEQARRGMADHHIQAGGLTQSWRATLVPALADLGLFGQPSMKELQQASAGVGVNADTASAGEPGSSDECKIANSMFRGRHGAGGSKRSSHPHFPSLALMHCGGEFCLQMAAGVALMHA